MLYAPYQLGVACTLDIDLYQIYSNESTNFNMYQVGNHSLCITNSTLFNCTF